MKKRHLERDLEFNRYKKPLKSQFKHAKLGLLVLTASTIVALSTYYKPENTDFLEIKSLNKQPKNVECVYNPNEVVCTDTTYPSETIISQDDVINFGAYVSENFPDANISETYGHPDNNKYTTYGPKQGEKYTVVLDQ